MKTKDYEQMVSEFVKDIVSFVNICIIEPYNEATNSYVFITKQQKEALLAIQELVLGKEQGKYKDKFGVSIMSGKGCHAKGTKVLMYNGICENVENIEVGDQLMGNDNTPRNVLSLKYGREQMYRINLNDGSSYDVNESHILSLRACESGQRGSLKWGNIVNVPVKEYLTWPNRKKKSYNAYKVGVEFPDNKEQLEIPPYILGIWLGDGDSDSARLINTDKSVINEWKKYGESLGLKYKCYNKIDHRIVCEVGKNNYLMNVLRNRHLINNKHISWEYLWSSRKDRLELLAGLIDTDGCKRKNGSYGISTNNYQLAREILHLVRSLGFRGSLNKQERIRLQFKKKFQVEYNINISRGKIEEIPVRIKWKKAESKNYKALNFNFTIEKLEINNYYGFELDGNHLYLLDDFSVTHNTGKDALATWAILWFMFCFPYPKIPCVSVSADQLNKVLWSEISKWLSHSKIKDYFALQNDKLFFKNVADDVKGRRWFAFPKTANPKASLEEQVETLQGIHEEYLMEVLDEVSGLLDPVCNALENNMTELCNFMLLIFNPMHTKGYAIRTQYEDKENWITFRWNAEDSEITNKERHKIMERKYGRDSNTYRMNVLGLPPVFDSETLIDWDWVMAAIDRPIEILSDTSLVWGIDCGSGGDKSIIAARRGELIYKFRRKNTFDSVELANWIGAQIDTDKPDCVRVDTIGIGWAVEGSLREKKGSIIEAADVRRKADDPERFVNKRAEMYWNLREQFERGLISIPNDSDLLEQIGATKYKIAKGGQIQIYEKDVIRKEIGHSPDELDATAILFYYPDVMVSKKRKFAYYKAKIIGTWQAA